MPLDFEGPMTDRVAGLNAAYKHHSAFAVLSRALTDPDVGRIALVSSFGAESVVLLHMLSVMDRNTPVLFLETGMLFPETLRYQQDLAEHLGLRGCAPDPAGHERNLCPRPGRGSAPT